MTVLAAVVALIASGHGHHADGCNHAYCQRRREVVAPYRARLDRIAWCETRRRWHLASGNGYYGGLQFDLATWQSVGGHRYPHEQNELNQKYRAVLLIRRRGYGPWPLCGRS